MPIGRILSNSKTNYSYVLSTDIQPWPRADTVVDFEKKSLCPVNACDLCARFKSSSQNERLADDITSEKFAETLENTKVSSEKENDLVSDQNQTKVLQMETVPKADEKIPTFGQNLSDLDITPSHPLYFESVKVSSISNTWSGNTFVVDPGVLKSKNKTIAKTENLASASNHADTNHLLPPMQPQEIDLFIGYFEDVLPSTTSIKNLIKDCLVYPKGMYILPLPDFEDVTLHKICKLPPHQKQIRSIILRLKNEWFTAIMQDIDVKDYFLTDKNAAMQSVTANKKGKHLNSNLDVNDSRHDYDMSHPHLHQQKGPKSSSQVGKLINLLIKSFTWLENLYQPRYKYLILDDHSHTQSCLAYVGNLKNYKILQLNTHLDKNYAYKKNYSENYSSNPHLKKFKFLNDKEVRFENLSCNLKMEIFRNKMMVGFKDIRHKNFVNKLESGKKFPVNMHMKSSLIDCNAL